MDDSVDALLDSDRLRFVDASEVIMSDVALFPRYARKPKTGVVSLPVSFF